MEDSFTWVDRNDKHSIRAKTLIYHDAICYGSDGKEYLVAADFNFKDFIQRYRDRGGPIVREFVDTAESSTQFAVGPLAPLAPLAPVVAGVGIGYAIEKYEQSVCLILLSNFLAGHRDDLQRNYDGYTNQDGEGFVKAFTPAASFVYGVACAILGVPLLECEAGGAAVNEKAKYTPPDLHGTRWDKAKQYLQYAWKGGNHHINTSGFLGNNPTNVANMKIGYGFVAKYSLDQYW